MQFTSLLFAAAALVGVNAAVNLTNTDYVITVGETFSIGWAGAEGPVTLTLKNGAALDLKTVSTITSGSTTSPYVWTVPSDLPIGNYAIEISDGTSTNYSPDFGLQGATATSSLAVSTSASASASASSASVSASATTSSSASASASTLTTVSSSGSTTASASATSSGNSTTSASSSASKTSSGSSSSKTTSASSSTSSSSVPNANSAAEIASPLALVFLTFAAILSLN
ncbi:hypothetical protein LHYA1_G006408 [Lachnellula hyalina]|uniref:Extracellular matrix protein n=1 Tax=Lachnellula hyalina TaxID=1316788 RepID=A0A8H8TW81_9HELO|nr:uncharacterized protein LHYA1_G006408 [Lachnellula hyalina]TVY24609.1 hypothetical protein LHYA1_G006408 [Lachnellula hyalina]